jgi:hypothetical protein
MWYGNKMYQKSTTCDYSLQLNIQILIKSILEKSENKSFLFGSVTESAIKHLKNVLVSRINHWSESQNIPTNSRANEALSLAW